MMKKRFARTLCLLLAACLLSALLPLGASAASRGNEPLYVCNLDRAGTDAFRTGSYFKARWIQVTATVPYGAQVRLRIVRDENRSAYDADDETAYDHTFENVADVAGAFVSPEIYLEYQKSATVPYRVELYVNGTLTRSEYVHRMLLEIKNKAFCVRGIRFRDIKPELTDEWLMFRPVDLFAADAYYGVQTFDLVASNMYLIGKLEIVRLNDRFMYTVTDIDTWNGGGFDKDAVPDDPYAPLILDHKIAMKDVSICFYPTLDDVQRVGDMPRAFLPGVWYSVSADLGGDPTQLLYLNGTVSYDPNGLERSGDSYSSDYVQSLVRMMP